ncbi:MAG: hypothetical protein ALECFALPRED_003451 [Alectoria fallacina]|uniref:Uncharacterized protein n=1 Tax=Alectoria fallacina TaxID=1903189 RepID=A0A8H3IPA4_9LECA|nr:MAG: hypothetical protein ALECFALPRED_003451 [Alectoria fallacina]
MAFTWKSLEVQEDFLTERLGYWRQRHTDLEASRQTEERRFQNRIFNHQCEKNKKENVRTSTSQQLLTLGFWLNMATNYQKQTPRPKPILAEASIFGVSVRPPLIQTQPLRTLRLFKTRTVSLMKNLRALASKVPCIKAGVMEKVKAEVEMLRLQVKPLEDKDRANKEREQKRGKLFAEILRWASKIQQESWLTNKVRKAYAAFLKIVELLELEDTSILRSLEQVSSFKRPSSRTEIRILPRLISWS